MAKEDDMEDEDIIVSNPKYILPRFNTLHTLAYEQLKYNDRSSAKETYQRMVMLYDELNKSNVPQHEKQRAYGKLMYVFTALSNPDFDEHSSTIVSLGKYLFPISLVLIILIIVLFIRPEFSLTGMAAADWNSAPEWVGGDAKFKVMGRTEINLDAYFHDADGDELFYYVGDAPNIDVFVSGSKVVITPDPLIKGMRVIGITAADSASSEKVVAVLDII